MKTTVTVPVLDCDLCATRSPLPTSTRESDAASEAKAHGWVIFNAMQESRWHEVHVCRECTRKIRSEST